MFLDKFVLKDNFVFNIISWKREYLNDFIYRNKLYIIFFDFLDKIWLIYSDYSSNEILPRIKFYLTDEFKYQNINFSTPYYILEKINQIGQKFFSQNDVLLFLYSLVFNLEQKIFFNGLVYNKGYITFGCYIRYFKYLYNFYMFSKIFDFDIGEQISLQDDRIRWIAIKEFYEKSFYF